MASKKGSSSNSGKKSKTCVSSSTTKEALSSEVLLENSTQKSICKKLFVQFLGKEFDDQQLFKIAEECYRADGHKDEIKDIKLYVKPEESKAYFVVNNSFSDGVLLY